MNSTELYTILGKNITILEQLLFEKNNPSLTKEEVLKARNAVEFLHDHKYRLKGQGLNQIESIILQANQLLAMIPESA